MEASFVIVFKGQVCANVLLFEVRAIADILSKSIVVGSVVVNATPNRKEKASIQGCSCMKGWEKQIIDECIAKSKEIIEIMQMDI